MTKGKTRLQRRDGSSGKSRVSRPGGAFLPLMPVTQKGGEIVQAWAMEGNCDPKKMKSNTFTMEWPPRSGRHQEFPEVDCSGWFAMNEAKRKINPAQISFLEELQRVMESKQSR